MAAVVHFFGKERPAIERPSVTLLQPITRGASDLRAALEARARLEYPARIQHVLVCDGGDKVSQGICKTWMARSSGLQISMVEVESPGGMASKTAKLQAGLAYATGDVVCCVDDDIIMRPDSLQVMIPYLCQPGVGAVFGLACYTDWSNLPSSLMSAFVNSNAILTYVPGTYLTEPFTITGHIFAVRRDTLMQVSGFAGLENNIADDHILAERVRSAGLRIVQTPMVYDVENHFDTFGEYASQMKRWFVFPRQALMPLMSPGEQAVTLALSMGNVIPGILLVMSLMTRKRSAMSALARSMAAFNIAYTLCEKLYLKRSTPPGRRPVVVLTALLAPLQIVGALLSSNEIAWRGRRLRIERGGEFTDLGKHASS
jgi:ceramide glucosyltransferase